MPACAALPPAAGLPAIAELSASPAWRVVEFISDLHLSAEAPRTLAAFEQYLQTTRADALFILGDLFEAWIGDDAQSLPFEARCTAALRAAGNRLALHVMIGNHDFLLDDGFFAATGAAALPDPCALELFGQRAVLTHGDMLCTADVQYHQRVRPVLRSAAWKMAFLQRPLAERAAEAARLRAASRAAQHGRSPESYPDIDFPLAGQWLAKAAAGVLIHGHTHRPAIEPRAEGWLRIALTDWNFDGARRGDVLRWRADAGFERVAPAAAP